MRSQMCSAMDWTDVWIPAVKNGVIVMSNIGEDVDKFYSGPVGSPHKLIYITSDDLSECVMMGVVKNMLFRMNWLYSVFVLNPVEDNASNWPYISRHG